MPGLEILWWALRDSNPEPRDYESPALTVAPRALMNGECNSNKGNSGLISSLHVVKYYHARGARSTHDLVDQEDHGAAFDLVCLYEKRPQLALEPHSMLGWRRGGSNP